MTTIDLSSGELAQLVKLAAKGTGYSWGVAGEVALISHWAVKNEPRMIHHLTHYFAWKYQTNTSVSTADLQIDIRSDKQVLTDTLICPITLGIALCDYAYEFNRPRQTEFADVISPILILPFCEELRKDIDYDIVVSWSDISFVVKQNAIYAGAGFIQCLEQSSSSCKALSLRIRLSDSADTGGNGESSICFDSSDTRMLRTQSPYRLPLHEDYIQQLKYLAHRTYAPATEESRMLGAGAGTSDND